MNNEKEESKDQLENQQVQDKDKNTSSVVINEYKDVIIKLNNENSKLRRMKHLFVRAAHENGTIIEASDVAGIDISDEYKFTDAAIIIPADPNKKDDKPKILNFLTLFIPRKKIVWVGWINEAEQSENKEPSQQQNKPRGMKPV